jgi:uncharacterized lipoprotein YddW (UPF0748 family)
VASVVLIGIGGGAAWAGGFAGAPPAAGFASATGTAPAAGIPERSAASLRPSGGERRVYLWVVRGALEDSVRFGLIADSARAVGCTDLIVQIRGRGDAWYRSATEPAPVALETSPPRGTPLGGRPSEQCLRFDAFAAALRAAKARDLRVHAWMNVFLVAGRLKPGPAHVLNRDPDWQIVLKDGRTIGRMREAERKRIGVEGVYLSPGNPEVLPYLESLVTEVASRYAIDGIHFDYIRYPYADAGYDPASLASFHDAHPDAPAEGDLWNDWRQEQVSRTVEAMSRAARAVRPGIEVSAAVLPDPLDARRSCQQDWPRWIREGWIDHAITMSYTTSADRFDFWTRVGLGEVGDPLRVVPGIGLHKISERALDSILERIRPDQGRSIALFSETEFMKGLELRQSLRSWGRK